MPPEVIALFLWFVTDTNDVRAAAGVCRAWCTEARRELRRRTLLLLETAQWFMRANPWYLFVAGSAALWLRLDRAGATPAWFPGDVDIFIINTWRSWWRPPLQYPTDPPPRGVALSPRTTFNLAVFGTRPADGMRQPAMVIAYPGVGKLHFVAAGMYSTRRQVLDTFDISACRVAWTADDALTYDEAETCLDAAVMYAREDTLRDRGWQAARQYRREKYERRGVVFARTEQPVNHDGTAFVGIDYFLDDDAYQPLWLA